ncbi:glycerophosphodiester phosphodiesterase family protein [Amycolatopsis endophytica]|uniref:Glycerophosphoryl diester phosphodiesterase n=1 Tax=Amycolatopsis endophytica TaxID=860233 RepID=A0A853B9J1_9PSEU|nr:glycerophosphodiester phosphodiesterase family protein [Amycolatopsis endophytica]NYI91432.1 glycerophosphoryl diester phosphodiesterase [Amycolatopsis endophytica]
MRNTAIRLALIALLGFPALVTGGTAVAAPEPGPDVIAHRGSSGITPENTAVALRTAIRQDADFVEIDVQRTSDGKLVNFHDCTLERTTDVEERFPGRPSYRVSDFTWAELRTLDAGSWFSGRYAGEPVISVDEVIRTVAGRTGLLAEISPCDHYDGLPRDLAASLRSHPRYVERALADGQLAVQSFVVEDAKTFHSLLPEVPIGVLDAERPSDAELTELSTWADDVNPQYTVTDQTLVDRVHELGMGINVWTVDEPGSIRKMAGLGVDGIITDYPQSLTGR